MSGAETEGRIEAMEQDPQDPVEEQLALSGDENRKYVVVTGASSGIGLATVRELMQRGYFVYGGVRTASSAAQLQQEFGESFLPLQFDVTDRTAVERAADQVEEHLGSERWLSGLVNSAGIAVAGPLMHIGIDDVRRQFEVNVFGTLAVTQALLPLLGAHPDAPADKVGRVVNLSSVSGHTAYPFLGPYAASKHALEALSDSLRRELFMYGVDVILIVPGAVNTPMWEKAESEHTDEYDDTDYVGPIQHMRKITLEMGREGMPAEAVARIVHTALTVPKPKTRYVLANRWWVGWMLPRLLPDRWLDRSLAGQLKIQLPDED